MIREIISEYELAESARVISESFRTVAEEFRFTSENCPSHPSFITREDVVKLKESGLRLFGLFTDDGVQAGFIAVENAGSGVFYIEKLSVLPEYRHRKYGSGLVDFAIDFIRSNGGTRVSIGIIDEHRVLKAWYKKFGFKETVVKRYDRLPFTVCFLEKNLSY